ncbi:alpha/beta hydrolase family protein [Flindersiella endophytica]
MVWIKRQVERLVETPDGFARLFYNRTDRVRATLVLGHGAGGGPDAQDLEALSAGLLEFDISVIRVEQPWHVAGKPVAPAPASLDRAWEAVIGQLRSRTPTFFGGRSAGARVACRTARRLGAVGCLALAFPLHPPKRPEKSRLDELVGARVPTLVVQGERDPFGTPEEFPPSVDLTIVPSAGHEFRVPKSAAVTQDEALDIIVEAAGEWIIRIVGPQ